MNLLLILTCLSLIFNALCQENDTDDRTKKIRVAYARNPPDAYANCLRFPQLHPDMACPFPGYTLEMMSQIIAYAGLEIEVVESRNVVGSIDWGTRLSNGTWVGVLGMLANDTADIVNLVYQLTDLRDQYFQFSYPLTNVQPIYVVHEKTQEIGSLLWNAFKPYSTVTWLVILGSFCVQAIMLISISRVEKQLGFRKRFRPFEVFWQCVQLQLDEHSEDMEFFTFAGNVVMYFFALLQSGLLIKLYEGLLLSALLAPPDTNPFKDADGLIELIGKGEYHLVTNYLGNWYFDDLIHSNDPHFVKLRAATTNNPPILATSVSAALDMVESGPYVYPIQEDSLAMQMSKERCGLVYVSQGLPQVSCYFVMQNDSVFLKAVNQAIIMNTDMIQRTFNKYFRENYKIGNIPKCAAITSTSTNMEIISKPLTLASTVGIFTLGAIGIAISLVAFFAEIYYFLHNRILDRHRRTRAAMAKNLLSLGRLYFTEIHDGVAMARLAEIIDKTLEAQEEDEEEKSTGEPEIKF